MKSDAFCFAIGASQIFFFKYIFFLKLLKNLTVSKQIEQIKFLIAVKVLLGWAGIKKSYVINWVMFAYRVGERVEKRPKTC